MLSTLRLLLCNTFILSCFFTFSQSSIATIRNYICPGLGLSASYCNSLNCNQYSPPIYCDFSTNTIVETLDFTASSVSGTISSHIGTITSLKSIWMSNNQYLTGTLPTELGKLSNLEDINVYGDGLSGPIPSELGKCSKLLYLFFYQNNFGSQIPAELGNLTQLSTLYLYENQFGGTIPASFASMPSLSSLKAEGNYLGGAIPNMNPSSCELFVSGKGNNCFSSGFSSTCGASVESAGRTPSCTPTSLGACCVSGMRCLNSVSSTYCTSTLSGAFLGATSSCSPQSCMPTASPTKFPTNFPTPLPSRWPTQMPSRAPTQSPTIPTPPPTLAPSRTPTPSPTPAPSKKGGLDVTNVNTGNGAILFESSSGEGVFGAQSTGALLGIVCGFVALLLAMVAIAFFFARKARKNKNNNNNKRGGSGKAVVKRSRDHSRSHSKRNSTRIPKESVYGTVNTISTGNGEAYMTVSTENNDTPSTYINTQKESSGGEYLNVEKMEAGDSSTYINVNSTSDGKNNTYASPMAPLNTIASSSSSTNNNNSETYDVPPQSKKKDQKDAYAQANVLGNNSSYDELKLNS